MTLANGIASAHSVTLTQDVVTESWTQMMSVTNAIADDYDNLADDNIRLAQVGPDVDNNIVQVVLAPSPAPHPSDPAYVSAAQADIDALVGAGVALVSSTIQTDLIVPADSRDNQDFDPWSGADGIYYENTGETCTDSWKVTYEPESYTGILTAGHCGTGSVLLKANHNQDLGKVIQRHYQNKQDDFEIIHTGDDHATVEIWKHDSVQYTPTEAHNPAIHTKVTINGDVSFEHGGLKISAVSQCFFRGSDYRTCGGDIAENPDGQACTEGDSGAPVYHQLGGLDVQISGMFFGFNQTECVFMTYRKIQIDGDLGFPLGSS